jgi:IPT/TIG domain
MKLMKSTSSEAVVITSVEPMQGHEGTVVTIKGRGFDTYNPIRNNCVVIGGMGACCRPEPDSTATELRVRIGPVAKEQHGDLLMWPGPGADLHTGSLSFGETNLQFSETALFRNAAPVASANIDFQLTKVSANTYSGSFERAKDACVSLGGYESGAVMRMSFPRDLAIARHPRVDVCVVLKEPTLALDFSADMSGNNTDAEECLRSIAKAISVNASLVGEKVFADVARNAKTGEWDLYVTKPYLENGMFTLRFAKTSAAAC